jgi:hypothetical protein
MTRDSFPNVTETYGQAVLFSYLIEDLLQIHLCECSHHHVNGYQVHSKNNIREKGFARLIREYRLVYPKHTKFADGLDKIRLIRNKLAHAWIDQVGSDLETDEGYDQIHALVVCAVRHTVQYLDSLKKIHEGLFTEAVRQNLEGVLSYGDEIFEAHVSTSDIQRLLDELDELASC